MKRHSKQVPIQKWNNKGLTTEMDELAVEEPLEIQLEYWSNGILIRKPISITMRTPGNDEELALGFLFTEGIIESFHEISAVERLPVWQTVNGDNVIAVQLRKDFNPDTSKLDRHFYTSSSCGVCGKSSIESIFQVRKRALTSLQLAIDPNVLMSLPQTLLEAQSVFESTGGLHAAGIFTETGTLITLREDVGRHNALDKIAGYLLNHTELNPDILLLSGRSSFELIQKAAMIGIPVVAAIGAPSSLAVELSVEAGISLVGFLKSGRFNVYSHGYRIRDFA